MALTQSDTRFKSEVLVDGEYYAFSQQEREKIRLGYIFTTWCGSPCGMYMKFFSFELGEPLALGKFDDSNDDKGYLRVFDFDSRNSTLINDVYNRAVRWRNKMRTELKSPQIDESMDGQAAVIVVNQGVLSAFYEKDDYWKKCSLL